MGLGALLLYVVVDELVSIVRRVEQHASAPTLSAMIGPRGARVLEGLGVSKDELVDRLRQDVEAAAQAAATTTGVIAAKLTNAVFGLLLALLTTYYVLLDWAAVARRLEDVLPIEPRYTRALMTELREVGRGALVGNVATAIVQGVLAGIGFWICRVDRPATWATLVALASFVPLIGTAVVWIPIGIYLLAEGHIFRGFLELLWGSLIVVTLSDYVIRPRLVGTAGHAHPLLVLVAMLGGLETMGLAGLIVGPILMSLFVVVLRIYERDAAAHRRLSPDMDSPSPKANSPDRVHPPPRP
jgi:predicted PurR-regulated permease PerM